MSVQYKSFYVPAKPYSNEVEEDLNQFLKSTNINNINKQFVEKGENSFWNFLIEYTIDNTGSTYDKTSSKRIDYREVLSPEDFSLFAKLREWRKKEADKEKIPVYTIFTNEQIANIARRSITTKTGLLELDGVGEARVKKYSDDVIKIVIEHQGLMNKKSKEKE